MTGPFCSPLNSLSNVWIGNFPAGSPKVVLDPLEGPTRKVESAACRVGVRGQQGWNSLELVTISFFQGN